MPENHPFLTNKRIVTSSKGKQITVNDHDCLNLGTHSYLGLLNSPEIEEDAIASVRKYGVGSCGPRGFYGTIGNILKNIYSEKSSNYIFWPNLIFRCAFGFRRATGKIHANGRISCIFIWIRNGR